jgi:hypothetical protein
VRCVFVGTPGYLGRLESETRICFWVDDPSDHGFDAARLIPIDLGLTPSAAAAAEISWDAVQVDDCISAPNGSLDGSSIGPRWPEIQLSGMVFLEERYWQSLPADVRPPCPPEGTNARDYEFKTVVYWPDAAEPRGGKRYAGHHAEVLDRRGSLARVQVYPQSRSRQPGVQPVSMWIDLSSPEQCDAGDGSLTEIAEASGREAGALFLLSGNV